MNLLLCFGHVAKAESPDSSNYVHFLNDALKNNKAVLKWTVPLKIYFGGEIPKELVEKWKRTFAVLSSASNINITYVDNQESANVCIIVTDKIFEANMTYKPLINRILRLSDLDYLMEAHRRAKDCGACTTVLPKIDSFELAISIVNKSNLLASSGQEALIDGSALASFVVAAPSDAIQPSLLNKSSRVNNITNVDIALIKALYDPSIHYLESKDEGIPIMAKIMSDNLIK